MTHYDPATRYPNMKPIKSAPRTGGLFGCGTGFSGRRDFDSETGAYVTTRCITLLMAPIFALGAYRVAPYNNRWIFLGKEPLSGFAKIWNIIFTVALVTTIAGTSVSIYTSTPAYKAHRQMLDAAALTKDGELAKAAVIYQHLALAGADESSNAAAALKDLVEIQTPGAALSQSAGALTAAARISHLPGALTPAQLVAKGMQLATDKSAADPQGGLAVLEAIRPLALDTRPIDNARLPLLKSAFAKEPTNLAVAVPYASLMLDQNQPDEAAKALVPLKEKLADGEGARVLGLVYAQQGKQDDAYALLWPYVKTRLDKLHVAEKRAEETYKNLYDQEIKRLNDQKGPQDFYQRYDSASKEGKDAVLREYMAARFKGNPEIAAAQEALEEQTPVVPTALELGILMLRRAQGLPDPKERAKQLQSAEETFLAVRGLAGQSDEYRLYLGQVYYWLGKQAEGRKLFDDFLTSKKRSVESLVTVGNCLRDVGAEAEARTLAEEGYNRGSDKEKYIAAELRSLLPRDIDDQISWTYKTDLARPYNKALLESLLGRKSMEQGKDAEAATHFQAAIDIYSSQPRNGAVLNNSAVAYNALYTATGDRKALDHYVEFTLQSLALEPSDPIVLYNSTNAVCFAMLTDLESESIDLRALHQAGSFDLFETLYRDEAGRQAVLQKLKDHPGTAKALAYADKTMVLAPRRVQSYHVPAGILSLSRDKAGIENLLARLNDAKPDLTDQIATIKKHLSGVDDKKNLDVLRAGSEHLKAQVDTLKPKGGLTAAVALNQYVDSLFAIDAYTHDVNPDTVLSLAREADSLAPNNSTDDHVIRAYCFRAAKDLYRNDPAFRQLSDKYVRHIDFTSLLLALANQPGPLQQKILAHPDVQQALALQLEQDNRFPGHPAIESWILQKTTNPAAAEKVAQAIRQNPSALPNQQLSVALNPTSAAEVLRLYWLLQLHNQPTEARDALTKFAALNIPIPPQP